LKYIILIITIFFFTACSNTKKEEENQRYSKQTEIKKIHPKTKNETISIKIEDLNLIFKNKKLIYPQKKVYLFFYDNSNFSKMQEEALNYLKVKFYKTNDEFLKKYFKITIYPTTIILDKNKTIKFENFTPIEILKGF
jgi:hypothetical protein